MLKIMTLGILAWSYWNPLLASITFVIFCLFLEGFLYINQFFNKLKLNESQWSAEEIEVLERYNLYFRFPLVSRSMSSSASAIQLSTFIWVPWLLYNNIWVPAVLIGINYFLIGPLAPFLNPRFFLHNAVEKQGKLEYLNEMNLVDSICEKIMSAKSGKQ